MARTESLKVACLPMVVPSLAVSPAVAQQDALKRKAVEPGAEVVAAVPGVGN